MSRLSRRQHARKGVKEAQAERLRIGYAEQALSRIEVFRLAGETDGHPFEEYKGEYSKVFYDIVLKDGTARLSCYPNAGMFTPFKGYDGRTVDGENVVLYRKSPVQYWDEVDAE